MKNRKKSYEDLQEDLGYPGQLKLDVEKYMPYVAHYDMSEEKKVELLESVWSMMRTFVELGWGVDRPRSVFHAPAKRHWEEDKKEQGAPKKRPASASKRKKKHR